MCSSRFEVNCLGIIGEELVTPSLSAARKYGRPDVLWKKVEVVVGKQPGQCVATL